MLFPTCASKLSKSSPVAIRLLPRCVQPAPIKGPSQELLPQTRASSCRAVMLLRYATARRYEPECTPTMPSCSSSLVSCRSPRRRPLDKLGQGLFRERAPTCYVSPEVATVDERFGSAR